VCSQRREAATEFIAATALRHWTSLRYSLFIDTHVPDDMAISSTSTTFTDGLCTTLSSPLSVYQVHPLDAHIPYAIHPC
jgi:hypothetical protein